jgi:diaminopimelate epimerase
VTAFVKLHGLGNDFVVMDRRAQGAPVTPEDGIALCDRHRGIGADGVLSIVPSGVAPIGMHVTNSDGSLAEMCGNGLRCVVRYAVDRGLLPKAGGPIETGRGVLQCFVESDGQIRIDMGAPVLEPARVPVNLAGVRIVDTPFDVAGESLRMTAVSMGNPHAVMFVDGERSLEDWATKVGPLVEHHPLFPRRTNAEFARLVEPDLIKLVVWERGSGLTQACGTGACATVVAAALTGRVPAGRLVRVQLPGGELRIRVESDLSRVWMTGPAVEVFSGETTLSHTR